MCSLVVLLLDGLGLFGLLVSGSSGGLLLRRLALLGRGLSLDLGGILFGLLRALLGSALLAAWCK